MTLIETFKKARKRAVPLIGIETADPESTMRTCVEALNGKREDTAVVQWDAIRGITGRNKGGESFVASIPDEIKMGMTNPSQFLGYMGNNTPEAALVFFHNAQLFYGNPDVAQGMWNLRDAYAANRATLVLLGPSFKLPPHLSRDVAVISEPLPNADEMGKTLDSVLNDWKQACDAAGKKFSDPDADARPVILDTLAGLSCFEAKQAIALALDTNSLDQKELWSRKVKAIEQTPGLAVWQGNETFDDLGGLDNLKQFLARVLTSKATPVRAIMFCDEIEKALAGAGGDTSGTSQDQLGTLLKVMQDENLPGMILLGHPGTGKSAIAKAAGKLAGAPVIACDLGAMKGSLVGESEQRIRAAMDVFKAISRGKGLVIATCNKISSLPPELRRRFALGTFFVDLPTTGEREQIWRVWIKRYSLDAEQPLPPSDSWTGAEIRACCDVAYRTGLPLTEAAQYIVPVIKSAPEQVRALQDLANDRFISASYPGTYTTKKNQSATAGARKMEI